MNTVSTTSHARAALTGLIAMGIIAVGSFSCAPAAAGEVDMWDGQWHYEISPLLWVAFLYTTVKLPPDAGGPTVDTDADLLHLQFPVFVDAAVRKGDWSLWTNLAYVVFAGDTTHVKEIGVPGVDPTLPVTLTLNSGLRGAIWALAPSYTLVRNDRATLDVLAGLRYTRLRLSMAYELTAPPTSLMRGGGLWPTANLTDGIVGAKGALRLSRDGKWFVPYEADVGAGNENWQWNASLALGYHFQWGDLTAGYRNFTLNKTNNTDLEKARLSGLLLGATFRW